MSLFDSDIILSIKESLINAKQIAIIGHKNIDGDCLGSTLAVERFFSKKNIETKIIVPNKIPEFFNWIEKVKDVIIYEENPLKADDFINFADIIFMLDFNDLGRIDDLADSIELAKGLKIIIDHHPQERENADFSFVDSKKSSAAELIFEFLKIINTENIDKKIAEYIYLGIVSDTGSFMYDSANSQTFKTASELLNFNINKSKIVNGLFNNYSFTRIKLIGHILDKNLVYLKEKNIAYIYISENEKKKLGYKSGDLENIVNIPLSISGVNFSVLFIETHKFVRVSLRSLGDFDVGNIAAKFFNGGGHKNAAGGKLNFSIKQTLDFFNSKIDDIIKTGLLS